MPTVKGTEGSLSYVQCFMYFVSYSINVFIFHITWLDIFWTDLVFQIFLNNGNYTSPLLVCNILKCSMNTGKQKKISITIN